MIEWFNNLSEGWQTAIFGAGVAVGLAVIGGLFGLFKRLFSKETDSPAQQTTIQQKGQKHTAIVADGNKGNIAGGDINTGIEPEIILDRNEKAYMQLGQSKEKIKNYEEKINQLEEQLARPQLSAEASESQVPQPTQEAKDLAAQIEDDAGPYAQALKAIAEGDNKQADELLDETQELLDHVQEQKDRAQAKIFAARMRNCSYAGRAKEALQYCDKLTTIAGEDPKILNLIATVYYENALYEKAEPLMERALAIDEASFGKDHPDVARDLNNLAQLYKATNRLSEAEPLMKRALAIDESSFGKDHPDVARDLNNLAALYKATNRLSEAEPLMKRALAIDEASLGKDHPRVAIDLNNLAVLYKASNRLSEAEPLMERVVEIFEKSLGKGHPNVATALNNLALLYQATDRLSEAEPLMKRVVEIFIDFTRKTGHRHPHLGGVINNYGNLLMQMGYSKEEADAQVKRLGPEMFE